MSLAGLDATSNNASRAHRVRRDFAAKPGRDTLADHYRRQHQRGFMFEKIKARLGMGDAAPAATTITPMEAHRRQAQGTLLIDVRHAPERAQLGVPAGAAWIDWTGDAAAFVAAAKAIAGGDTTMPIALICRSGVRSGHAQLALQAAGFANVVNVVGGFDAGPENWRASGLPVEGA